MSDEELWQYVTRSVKPLAFRRKKGREMEAAPASRSVSQLASKRSPDADPVSPDLRLSSMPILQPSDAPLPDTSKRTAFLDAEDASRTDTATLQRLRKGEIPFQAKLDLHGYTLQEAHGLLHRCMRIAIERKARCMLVVTGKGKLGTGAIRESFPGWLNHPELLPHIQCYCAAPPKLGGSGAWLVLLRRQRQG